MELAARLLGGEVALVVIGRQRQHRLQGCTRLLQHGTGNQAIRALGQRRDRGKADRRGGRDSDQTARMLERLLHPGYQLVGIGERPVSGDADAQPKRDIATGLCYHNCCSPCQVTELPMVSPMSCMNGSICAGMACLFLSGVSSLSTTSWTATPFWMVASTARRYSCCW